MPVYVLACSKVTRTSHDTLMNHSWYILGIAGVQYSSNKTWHILVSSYKHTSRTHCRKSAYVVFAVAPPKLLTSISCLYLPLLAGISRCSTVNHSKKNVTLKRTMDHSSHDNQTGHVQCVYCCRSDDPCATSDNRKRLFFM